MVLMEKVRTGELKGLPLPGHGIFVGLWVLLLILGSALSAGPNSAWALVAGLAPILAGFLAFRFWKREHPSRWVALIAGEALGVVLGSTLVAGPDSPLMLLALWPVACAAIKLAPREGVGLVAGMELVYLVIGLWQAGQHGNSSQAIMGLLLYVGALYGVFALLRERERALAAAATPPAQVPAAAAPAPAVASSLQHDETLHQDLAVARDIQVSLLLASSPRLPGWESSTSFLPARELGGDLYDFVELEPPNWGIMIGDVSGKGIPAALHMAVARTLFRMETRNKHDPAHTLSQLNQFLIEQIPQGCVTLLYAKLNTSDGALRLANAGHNYPLLLNNSVHELSLDGLPLGIDAEYVFAEAAAHLDPGDVLVFYTDGVVEAVNAQGEIFGFERLRQLLGETTIRRPRSLTRQIVRAVRAFTTDTPQSDDITLVVLRRRYEDRVQEMAEVAQDVLGPEGGAALREYFATAAPPADATPEAWRAAIQAFGGTVRERWGQGLSRELLQQLFLTLEGL